MSDALKAILSTADKITSLAEDGLRGIDLTIGSWPADFRAIVWDAVAEIAARRARVARIPVSSPPNPGDRS